MMSRLRSSVPLGCAASFAALLFFMFTRPEMAQTNGILADPGATVITFDKAEVTGRWVDSWQDNGVVFAPAHVPNKSKAKARLMFFPHAPSGRKGILSAMADDPIPVRISFTNGCSSVTISFWGSTDCAARLEAYNAEGQLLDQSALEKIPGRKAPDEPIPTFELTVRGTNIAYAEFSGPRAGEYLVAEEVRFSPVRAAGK